jgi:hypothetical protein
MGIGAILKWSARRRFPMIQSPSFAADLHCRPLLAMGTILAEYRDAALLTSANRLPIAQMV